MSHKGNRIQLLAAWASVLAGAAIYLLFRSRAHLGFLLLDALGCTTIVDAVRACVRTDMVPEFVRFCLPDGLWTTSYILFSDYYNRNEVLAWRVGLVSVIPMLGIASELLQLTPLIPGTFDVLDLASYSLPLISYIGIIIFKKL